MMQTNLITLSSRSYRERKMKNLRTKYLAQTLGYKYAVLCPGVWFWKVPQCDISI
jgi:hypothetical protein